MKITLRAKIISALLIAAVIPMSIMGIVSFLNSKDALVNGFTNQLNSINGIKKSQIENFFKERRGDIKVLSNTPYVIEFANMGSIVLSEAKGKGITGKELLQYPPYKTLHNEYHNKLDHYMKEYGYYDIFLMTKDNGHIFYSAAKEGDFNTIASNIDSGLSSAWKKAINTKQTVLTDTSPYAPSNNAPAQFMATPIYSNGKLIAILGFQIPLDPINQIMGNREGMGKSGESYLVGSDQLMRSDSFLDPKNHTVVASFKNTSKGKVNTTASLKALQNNKGSDIIVDYNGNPVLSSYDSVNLGSGLFWGILSEIDEAEVLIPVLRLRTQMIILLLIIIAIFTTFGLLFGRSISNPILRLANMLGDSSAQVSSASSQLSSASQELSSSSNEQASSIQETSSSLEEITGMVNSNVDNAKICVNISQTVSDSSDKGNTAMQELIKSMADILESNEKIQQLVKVIGEIGEKTAIIDEIVFQTKLLSFNASVEAERAGEHGRGFAVVAQEVGNLAQMSGKAATEISDIVKEGIKNTEKITVDNKKKVETGNEIVKNTADILKEISTQSSTLLENMNNILSASQDQATGIGQINTAITQLDKATQENAGTAEETASSSEELQAQSQNLKSMVDSLTTIVNGEIEEKQIIQKSNSTVTPTQTNSKNIISINTKKEVVSKIDDTNESTEWEAI